MFQAFINNIEKFLGGINPLILFALVLLIGAFIFWQGCSKTEKNTSSIFDMFFLSTVVGIAVGRISHIINSWGKFTSYIWYWLPYEKYGNEVFLFRLLPWRFFRVWDWGIDILNMIVGFLIMSTIWTLLVKKWKWSELYYTIYLTVLVILGMTFLLLGGASKNVAWMVDGTVMISIPITIIILQSSVGKVLISGKRGNKVQLLLNIFYVLISIFFIAYTYFSMEISNTEKIGVILFTLWAIVGLIFSIIEIKKGNVTIEKVSSVGIIPTIDINQPIKMPK